MRPWYRNASPSSDSFDGYSTCNSSDSGGEEIEIAGRCPRLTRSCISVGSAQCPAMPITDTLDRSLCGHDVETPSASDCDLADIHASIPATRHNSPDKIAGAKALDSSRRLGQRAREAVLIH